MHVTRWALALALAAPTLSAPPPSRPPVLDTRAVCPTHEVVLDARGRPRPAGPHDTNPTRRPTRHVAASTAGRVRVMNALRRQRRPPPPGEDDKEEARCEKRVGVVRARVAIGGGVEAVGYVGRGGNSYGEYEMTTERGQALAVRVPVCPEPDEDEDEVSAEVFGMETLDGYADFTFLGGTTGHENWGRDLKSGTADFVYLVGTGQEPQGAALPAKNSFAKATYMGMSPAQSEMWTLDPYGDRLVPTWTNSDGRMANAAVVYVPDSNAFALVGDMDAYKKRYGDAWDTTFAFEQM